MVLRFSRHMTLATGMPEAMTIQPKDNAEATTTGGLPRSASERMALLEMLPMPAPRRVRMFRKKLAYEGAEEDEDH